jgi:hypothetical protein
MQRPPSLEGCRAEQVSHEKMQSETSREAAGNDCAQRFVGFFRLLTSQGLTKASLLRLHVLITSLAVKGEKYQTYSTLPCSSIRQPPTLPVRSQGPAKYRLRLVSSQVCLSMPSEFWSSIQVGLPLSRKSQLSTMPLPSPLTPPELQARSARQDTAI